MLALRIDLLTGRYAATAYNDRDRVEWPPHPARLFSALVAAWADGNPGTADGDAELAALRWLEAQPPPAILATPIDHAGVRTAAPVFVPVNDVGVIRAPDHAKLDAAERAVADASDAAARTKAEKQLAKLRDKLAQETAKELAVPSKFGKHDTTSAEQALIDRRVRQPRTFPCAVPETPAFAFEWPRVDVPREIASALARLASRLVRLGHSSSLVHVAVSDGTDADLAQRTTLFVPDDDAGDLMIRWVDNGQTERLIRAHAQHQQVEPRVLPARVVAYRRGESQSQTASAHSAFDIEPIIYTCVSGPRLPVTSAAGLSRQFRRALMSVADEPVDQLISGHHPDGSPSEPGHLAIAPLPWVLGLHATGAILGIALILPRAATGESRRAVLRALGRLEQPASDEPDDAPPVTLQLGEAGALVLRRDPWGDDRRATLRSRTWTRASQRWASATPVALDRNPGDLHDRDPAARAEAFAAARRSIIESIERIGLPPPLEVDVSRSCVLPGTAKPRSYPRFPIEARKQQRVLVHVRLEFAAPVQGPLLIGAGRFQGLGLCLPVDGPITERSW